MLGLVNITDVPRHVVLHAPGYRVMNRVIGFSAAGIDVLQVGFYDSFRGSTDHVTYSVWRRLYIADMYDLSPP